VEEVTVKGSFFFLFLTRQNYQMTLFSNKQTKKMTLDKTQVLKEAEKVYHPK
jgi:hypothetical protein